MNKAERLAKAKRDLEKVLKRTGVTALKNRHKKKGRGKYAKYLPNEIPDYSVESTHDLSNSIGNGLKVRTGAHHPDAKQFPVGNSHKQGLELIYSEKFVSQMNGKKT